MNKERKRIVSAQDQTDIGELFRCFTTGIPDFSPDMLASRSFTIGRYESILEGVGTLSSHGLKGTGSGVTRAYTPEEFNAEDISQKAE
jgi:hypothetical protein